VRRPNIRRGKDSVSPGISERHKVTDDDVSASGSDGWGVFQEHPGRSNSINCPGKLFPEPTSLACDACPVSGEADVLARESAAERIDWIQSFKVHGPDIPFNDVQSWESLSEYLTGVWVEFDGPLWIVAVDEVGKDAPACACE
jgi:hypothetical protein